MPDFKVIKNPDGSFSTAPDYPTHVEEKVKATRKSLRDILDGGGWFDDPLSKKVEPESKTLLVCTCPLSIYPRHATWCALNTDKE